GAGVRFRIWRQTALGLALVALVCTIVVITSRAWPDKPGLGYPGFWVPLACGGAVLVLLALGLGSVRRRPLWIGLIVIAAFVELRLTLGGYFFSPMSASRAAGPEHFPDVVRALRAAQHGEAPTRCLIENGAWRSV